MSGFRITCKYKENALKNTPTINNTVSIRNFGASSDSGMISAEQLTTVTDEKGVTTIVPPPIPQTRPSSSESEPQCVPAPIADSVDAGTAVDVRSDCCNRQKCVQSNDPCRITFER